MTTVFPRNCFGVVVVVVLGRKDLIYRVMELELSLAVNEAIPLGGPITSILIFLFPPVFEILPTSRNFGVVKLANAQVVEVVVVVSEEIAESQGEVEPPFQEFIHLEAHWYLAKGV